MNLPEKYPVYFERRKGQMFVVLLIVIISGYITYYSFKAYTVYHIYSAFVCAGTLVYLSWLYFNPFCVIENTHFEINTGLFSHRKYTYRDIQKVEYDANNKMLVLILNDYEVIEISIKPVQKQERTQPVEIIKLHVYKDVLDRE